MLRPRGGTGLVLAVGGLVTVLVAIAYAAPIGTLKQFRVPTRNSSPLDITQGSDGNFWFTEGNVNPPQPFGPHNVGRITPAGDVTEFAVCTFCFPNRIVQGPGGILYFTKSDPGLGRITTDGVVLSDVVPPNTCQWQRRRRSRRRHLFRGVQHAQHLALQRHLRPVHGVCYPDAGRLSV